ncbi:acyl-CoA carboxylase subunit beta [Seongchinamella sediminis]|uniref:Acyl-CoA carboxylase subunit beta n=1 Tax=Seongchinamella sediminis TaxID=2283635 RepID=A0A3L7DZF1_9GAMM|nr:carboxyl transferase domain-containing protein [Seongchinamella sediminis]RLQ22045.1 acyl-CoA carboxylase subunit beta [Seongchinamella sediminis]
MPQFQSRINTDSDEFRKNREDMLASVGTLREVLDRAATLSDKSLPRFEKRGQILPRERLTRLLDPGMPFLELLNMAGFTVDTEDRDASVPGCSMIAGIGYIAGTRCMIMVDDSGINAGAMTALSTKKGNRVMDIARDKKLPLVHLVESAGANLMEYEVEMWMDGGGIFARLARLSAAGVPTFVILHGASAAGGAYMPGMSDYVIGVKGNGKAYLAGPALLKAATGEEANDDELGGAQMHATVSGLVEYLAEDDAHGIALCRELLEKLDWNRLCPNQTPRAFEEPVYASEELLGIVPADYRQPYDVREVVARIVDASDILDFKPGYGPATVCMQARVFGIPVGIIGNNGPIDTDGATKCAQFIQLCDQSDVPLVFLQNITGYMVGTEFEQAGMIKHGAKMIQAVTNARVPRITFMIGASFGAGNYGMCGQGYDPDFLFSWPNINIGVMGGESAARTMSEVMLAGARRKGIEVPPEVIEAQEAKIIAHFNKQSDAFYTSGRMLDDGIIDPRDTRKVLGFVLQTCWEARNRTTHPNTFGVGRM